MDPDAFRDGLLKFELRKPAAWRFMPPAWSPVAQLRNGSDAAAWIRYARLPFCCAMGAHDSAEHALPTLQVTARPGAVPSNAEAADLLSRTLGFLSDQYVDLAIVDATSDAVVGGHRANVVRARFSLWIDIDGQPRAMPVASRSYTVFGTAHTFTLGLSGSADARYLDEADLDRIVQSVRIGR